jgi:threonine dehydratase
MNEIKIDKEILQESYLKISKILTPTPLVYNQILSKKYGCNVFLKLENLQPIGSFKIRGALNKISKLTDKEKKKGIIACSAGNHAQGVAWASRYFNVSALIVMPKNAPLTKIENTKALGAKVLLHGFTYEEAYEEALRLKKKHDFIFVHPYLDKDIIAGQASIFFELQNQLKKIDFIIGSVGGGGLMSGVSLASKFFSKNSKIIVGQAMGANSMVLSLQKGKIVKLNKPTETFADGIKVKDANPKIFNILKENVDYSFSVSDDLIAESVLELMEKAHIVSEGSGAVPLAVLKLINQNKSKLISKKNIVLIVSGGNIDINLVDRIIEKGLLNSGRRLKILVTLKDRPGELEKLTKIIKSFDANILQVTHDRSDLDIGLNETSIQIILETRGKQHSNMIIDGLKKFYNKVVLN